MDDDERAALLSAMYDAHDEEPDPKRPAAGDALADPAGMRKSRRMVMGAVAFDVPTVEYVDSLERRLGQSERTAAEQGRHLKRLEILVSTLRNVLRRHAGAVNDVARDLDRKLDRRDP